MEYTVPVNQTSQPIDVPIMTTPRTADPELQQLEMYWGADICRLEYLIYLLETGRIQD